MERPVRNKLRNAVSLGFKAGLRRPRTRDKSDFTKARQSPGEGTRMAASASDCASLGRTIDQVYRDFCRVRPDNLSSDMLRGMLGATFAGIQAMPVGNRYDFEYLVQAGFDERPWVHNKLCQLSRSAKWDVTGADPRSPSDVHLFDIFERLSDDGAGGQLRSYFDHIGVRHALMSCCLAEHGWQYVMFAGRSPGQDGFDDADRARLKAMLPHFRCALRARIRLIVSEGMAEACAAGVERLGIGVVLIDGKGQTSYLNSVAERILAADDGLVIQPRFGASTPAANKQLQSLLRAAARADWTGGGVAMTVPRPSGACNYELVVDAQPQPIGLQRKGEVVVYLRDRAAAPATIEAELLEQFFGFTEAEALLVCAAANGRSTHDIARLLGIQYNTVRAHFRSIYAKRGWSNRSDLVQMVLGSPATLGAGRVQSARTAHLS